MALISRADWGARPPKAAPTPASFTEPTTAHWHGPSVGWPFDHDHCYELVRSIQAFHMDSRGWNDIAYNGLVCNHGDVFEGRGPNVRSAANGDNTSNAASPALCFLAGEGDEFTDASKAGFLEACDWLGSPPGHVHRDWFNTSCPGDERAAWVQAGAPAPSPQEDDLTPEQATQLATVHYAVNSIVLPTLARIELAEYVQSQQGGVDVQALADRLAPLLTSDQADALADELAKRLGGT